MTTGKTFKISLPEPKSHFLPASPPKAPRSVALNALSLLKTPYVALAGGISPDDAATTSFHDHKVPFGSRRRIKRSQVGSTNHWQLPCNLDCDLLGTSQAQKAIRRGFNETLRCIMTADTPASRGEDGSWGLISRPSAVTPLPPIQTPRAGSQHTISRPSKHWRSHYGQAIFAPEEVFFYHAQQVTEGLEPEIELHCLGLVWLLHRPYLIKSATLSRLFKLAVAQKRQQGGPLAAAEQLGKASSRQDQCPKLPALQVSFTFPEKKKKESSPKKVTWKKVAISLDVEDELVTKVAFSSALMNLYHSKVNVDQENVVGLLASAYVLQFPALFQECVLTMKNAVSSTNISKFYYAGCKYKQDALVKACEQWLEMNLVPHLGCQIYLRQLPQELLQKVLKSPRLFTFNEYRLLRTTLYWVFLQQNPAIQILPVHNTVLSYFSSLPKRCAFLETQMGQRYTTVFQSLRLHGVTESRQLEELRRINVLPQASLIGVLSNHHHALQNGGDMPLQMDFFTQAVRFGLIIDEEPQHHAELISRYGFFFELKAVRHEASMYSFYMQRIKHTNPVLSFRTAEQSSFSLKQEREVKYRIAAHALIHGKWKEFSMGPLIQRFGITNRTRESKVLKVCIPSLPIYVTFALLFVPS